MGFYKHVKTSCLSSKQDNEAMLEIPQLDNFSEDPDYWDNTYHVDISELFHTLELDQKIENWLENF